MSLVQAGDVEATHHETRVVAMFMLTVCIREALSRNNHVFAKIYRDRLRELSAIDGSW
jgi:hypothetical protein